MPAHRTRDTQSRSLEVTTDAPSPPMLTIISPTPRAFTFPTSHNLSDSPYSTPSNSPFEPDLRSLALSSASSSCTTPPPLLRTLTPDSATSVSSSSHIRRKSSLTSSDVERRPKKGDEDYIKRPENAFILFRRKCCEERQQAETEEGASKSTSANKKQRQADLSKAISQQWKALSTEERQYWEQLAKEKKKEHEQLYPNYVYRPQRVRDKDGKARNKKRKGITLEAAMEKDKSISFVIPPRQHQGRSASAPTPPPMSYQTIQVPTLFTGAPSCPTSPSLLPMISRRAAHTGNPEDVMSNFDYRPSEHFTPPQGDFGVGLQPSFYDPISQQQPSRLIMPSAPVLSGQIVSPASSGPSSPAAGPFTPTSAILPPLHQHASFTDLDTEPELQDQEYMLDYASCGWGSSIWDNNESSMLTNSDFDLNSIPPMALGFSKDVPSFESSSYAVVEPSYEGYSHDNYMDYSHDMEYSQPQDESLMNFDEIITGRHLQA